MEKVTIRLEGVKPLVMANNQMVNPRNIWKKRKSALTDKKKKTDADHDEIARIEFVALMYINDEGPYIPANNFRACLIDGAKKDKNGTTFKSAVFVVDDAQLEYEGPRDTEAMWKSGEFEYTTVVGNQRSSIMRTRPRFDTWSATFEVEYDPEMVDIEHIENAVRHAQKLGICDGRAIGYGRFRATVTAVKKVREKVRK